MMEEVKERELKSERKELTKEKWKKERVESERERGKEDAEKKAFVTDEEEMEAWWRGGHMRTKERIFEEQDIVQQDSHQLTCSKEWPESMTNTTQLSKRRDQSGPVAHRESKGRSQIISVDELSLKDQSTERGVERVRAQLSEKETMTMNKPAAMERREKEPPVKMESTMADACEVQRITRVRTAPGMRAGMVNVKPCSSMDMTTRPCAERAESSFICREESYGPASEKMQEYYFLIDESVRGEETSFICREENYRLSSEKMQEYYFLIDDSVRREEVPPLGRLYEHFEDRPNTREIPEPIELEETIAIRKEKVSESGEDKRPAVRRTRTVNVEPSSSKESTKSRPCPERAKPSIICAEDDHKPSNEKMQEYYFLTDESLSSKVVPPCVGLYEPFKVRPKSQQIREPMEIEMTIGSREEEVSKLRRARSPTVMRTGTMNVEPCSSREMTKARPCAKRVDPNFIYQKDGHEPSKKKMKEYYMLIDESIRGEAVPPSFGMYEHFKDRPKTQQIWQSIDLEETIASREDDALESGEGQMESSDEEKMWKKFQKDKDFEPAEDVECSDLMEEESDLELMEEKWFVKPIKVKVIRKPRKEGVISETTKEKEVRMIRQEVKKEMMEMEKKWELKMERWKDKELTNAKWKKDRVERERERGKEEAKKMVCLAYEDKIEKWQKEREKRIQEIMLEAEEIQQRHSDQLICSQEWQENMTKPMAQAKPKGAEPRFICLDDSQRPSKEKKQKYFIIDEFESPEEVPPLVCWHEHFEERPKIQKIWEPIDFEEAISPREEDGSESWEEIEEPSDEERIRKKFKQSEYFESMEDAEYSESTEEDSDFESMDKKRVVRPMKAKVIREPMEEEVIMKPRKEDLTRRPSKEVVKWPTKKEIPDTTKDEVIWEPSKAELIREPTEEEVLLRPTRKVIPEPTKEKVIWEPSKAELIREPTEKEVLLRPTRKVIPEPTKEKVIWEPPKEDLIRKPTKEVIQEPEKEMIQEPEKKEGFTKPTEDKVHKPIKVKMAKLPAEPEEKKMKADDPSIKEEDKKKKKKGKRRKKRAKTMLKRATSVLLPDFMTRVLWSEESDFYVTKMFIGAGVGGFAAIGLYFMLIDPLMLHEHHKIALFWGLFAVCVMGWAISPLFRCACFLILPQVLGKEGRTFLLIFVMATIYAGPIANIEDNLDDVVSSIGCTVELQINHTKMMWKVMLAPIKSIVGKLVNEGKGFNMDTGSIVEKFKDIKDEVMSNEGIDEKKEAAVERKLRNSRKIGDSITQKLFEAKTKLRCEYIAEQAELRCHEWFDKKHEECMRTIWVPILNHLLCLPMKFKFLCKLVHLMTSWCKSKIPVEGNFGKTYDNVDTTVVKLGEAFETDMTVKQEERPMIVGEKIDTSQVMEDMRTDVTEKKIRLQRVTLVVQAVMSLTILLVFVSAFSYISKYNADIRFDNLYITTYFKQIDARRWKMGKRSLLPLKKGEAVDYIFPFQLAFRRCEMMAMFSELMHCIPAVLFLIAVCLIDYLLTTIFLIIRRHSMIEYTFKSEHELDVKIGGEGMIARLLRNTIGALSSSSSTTLKSDNIKCVPNPMVMEAWDYFLVIWPLLCLIALCLLQAYVYRVRRAVAAIFFPKREKRRILFLYNEMLRKRQYYIHRQKKHVMLAARRNKVMEAGLLGKLLRRCPRLRIFNPPRCIVCNDKKTPKSVMCGNPECKAVYCRQCWAEMKKVCYACLPPEKDEFISGESNDEDVKYAG